MTHQARDKNPLVETAGQNFSFLDFNTIWRKKHYLLLSVVLTTALGGLYLQNTTALYEAEARLLVQQDDPLDSDRAVRPDRSFLHTQAEIIRSPVTVQRAIESIDSSQPENSHVNDISLILKSLRVSPLVDTHVLKLSIRSADAEYSIRLIESIIDSYRDHVAQLEHDQNIESLEREKLHEADLYKMLESLRQEHAKFRNQSDLIGQGKEAIAVHMSTLRNLGDTLNATRNRRMDLESQLALHGTPKTYQATQPGIQKNFANRLNTSVASVDIISTPIQDAQVIHPEQLPAFRENPATGLTNIEPARIEMQLLETQARANQLSRIYGPKHPELQAVHAEIASLNKRRDASQKMEAASLSREIASAKMTENNLQQLYQNELEAAKTLDAQFLKEQQLLERIRQAEETHQASLTNLAELKLADSVLQKGHSSMHIEMLESPELTQSQVWPQPIQFLFACMAFGLAAGCVLISLLEKRHTDVLQH